MTHGSRYSYSRGRCWAGIAQSVQRLASNWTVQRPKSDGVEISRTRSHRPRGPPSLLHEYQFSYPGVKRPGRGVKYPSPCIALIKETLALYLWVFMTCCRVTFTFHLAIGVDSGLWDGRESNREGPRHASLVLGPTKPPI